MKVPPRIQPLVDAGVVHEVVQPLMSGKEAAAWIVRAGDEFVVAKVYKEATQRSFRQRAVYAEGRKARRSRDQRAMDKGSRYGQRLLEESWQNAEVDALFLVSEAGVRAPKPHIFMEGVLLMDLVLDADGHPAPRLFDVDLSPDRAREVHKQIVRDAVRMLCAGIVHGDLSEYNVLMAWDGPVIIDLPQAVNASGNRNAQALFERDLQNVASYLARFAPEVGDTRYGPEIWDLFRKNKLHPEIVLTGQFAEAEGHTDTSSTLRAIATAQEDYDRQVDDRKPRRKRGRRGSKQRKQGGNAPKPSTNARKLRAPRAEAASQAPSEAASHGRRVVVPQPVAKPNPERSDGAPPKRRRKRSRRRGGKAASPGPLAVQSPDVPRVAQAVAGAQGQAETPPRKRRRRRRRRKPAA